MDADDRQPVEALLEALEADDAILDQTVAELRATLPGYNDIPAESVRESARRNRALSIRTILEGRAPDADHVAEAVTLADERAAQGVSIGPVLAGFRVSMSLILRRLLELAPRHGIQPDTALTFSTLLWALGDAFTTRAVVVYRDRSIAQEVADTARRTQWITDAVAGGLDRTELLAGAAAYNVPMDRPVRAVRADVGPVGAADRNDDGLQRWAHPGGPTAKGRALLAPRGDGAAGILHEGDDTEPAPAGVTIAVGPPVGLEGLPASFAVATRVLEAAQRVGATGVVDVETLSWRMGIHASPETTAMLLQRHIEPVRAEGPFGELVLEALAAYLAHRMNIPLAAASIPTHVNTLRYRLKRYRDLTGADLNDLETLIEVSWALAAGNAPSHPSREEL